MSREDKEKEVINTLERLCAEPEPIMHGADVVGYAEPRLDADEVDAVLFAIDFIKENETLCGSWLVGEDEDGKYIYCSNCDRVHYRYPFWVKAMRYPRYCEFCGSLNNEEGKV